MPQADLSALAHAIRAEVARRGIASAARALRVSRHSITAYLAGIAPRPGTVALVETRARELGWTLPNDRGGP